MVGAARPAAATATGVMCRIGRAAQWCCNCRRRKGTTTWATVVAVCPWDLYNKKLNGTSIMSLTRVTSGYRGQRFHIDKFPSTASVQPIADRTIRAHKHDVARAASRHRQLRVKTVHLHQAASLPQPL